MYYVKWGTIFHTIFYLFQATFFLTMAVANKAGNTEAADEVQLPKARHRAKQISKAIGNGGKLASLLVPFLLLLWPNNMCVCVRND